MERSKSWIKVLCIGLGVLVVILLFVVAFLLGQRSMGGRSADKDAAGVGPKSAEAPRSLEISMSSGTLTFEDGIAFAVDYDDSVIRVSNDGDTMEIKNLQDRPTAAERQRMNVTVTVPNDVNFSDVDVDFGAGKLIVRALRTQTLELDLGAGSATLNDLFVTASAEIQEGAGELTIGSGEIANLELECGAGASRVAAKLTGSSHVQAAFGAVDIDLKGQSADYTVTFRMGLGECYFNNEKIARSGSFGTGANSVLIDCGLGLMRVNTGV